MSVLVGSVTEDGAVYEIYAEETVDGVTFTIQLASGNGDLLGFYLDYSADANPALGAHDVLVTDSYFGEGGDGQDPAPPPGSNDGDDTDGFGPGNNVNGLG